MEAPDDVTRIDRDVVDGPEIVEREVEGAALPGDQIVDRLLDLLLDRAVHPFLGQAMLGDEDLAERPPRLLLLLLPQGAGQRGPVDGAVIDEEFAELLGARPPGVDDSALVEPDSRVDLAGDEGEGTGAAAEMDELQG